MIKRGLFALLIQFFFCFHAVAQEDLTEFEFSQAELDQILAPIALYPDTILSHILIASTYPLEVIQAHRWAQNNEGLSSDDVAKAVENRDWDPSVKALAPFPNILKQMSEDLDWMQKLGDAFLQNEELVLASIQDLRQRAHEEGNLGDMEHLTVKHEDEHIIIEPSTPEVVYVPYYDTRVVYGSWWWVDYPPVIWAHHHHHYSHHGPWLYWGPRVHIGSGFYFSSFHWHRRHIVVINHNHHRRHRYPAHYVSHHRDARRWEHNTRHRRGVEYRHPRISERHNINVRHPRTSNHVANRLRENNYSRQHHNDHRSTANAHRDREDRRSVWRSNSRQEQNTQATETRQPAQRQNREQRQNVKRTTPPKKIFSHDRENQRYSRQQESRRENTTRYERDTTRSSSRTNNSSSRASNHSTRRSNSGASSSRQRNSSAARSSRHQR